MHSISDHPAFTQPLDENSKVWRYMSLDRFDNFVKNGLYFAGINQLRAMDSYEGKYPNFVEQYWQHFVLNEDANKAANAVKNFQMLRWFVEKCASRIRINCWHLSEYESVAMWSIYAKNKGVAIQTTYKKLAESISKVNIGTYSPFVGLVRYVDYNTKPTFSEDSIPYSNIYMPFMSKRIEYAYEKEVRILIDPIVLPDFVGQPGEKVSIQHPVFDDLFLPIDGSFIQQVVLSPMISDADIVRVRDLVNNHNILVIKSALSI